MANLILHMNGLFFDWSTVVDGPATFAQTRTDYVARYIEEHGPNNLHSLNDRLDRAVATGTSSRIGASIASLTEVAGLNGNKDWDTPEKLFKLVTAPPDAKDEKGHWVIVLKGDDGRPKEGAKIAFGRLFGSRQDADFLLTELHTAKLGDFAIYPATLAISGEHEQA